MSGICELCGAALPSGRAWFLVGESVACRRCHDHKQPTCPYCHEALARCPTRKTRCKHCGESIYVRSTNSRFDSALVTKSQAEELDARAWLSAVSRDSEDFDRVREMLRKRFCTEPNVGDVIWGVLNAAAMRESDPFRLASIEVMRAERLGVEGKDPNRLLLREALRGQYKQLLDDWKAIGVREVRISGCPERCRACKRLPRGAIAIEDAIRSALLPHADCTTDAEEFGGYGRCRCLYSPVTASD
jgi:hypothetical protein